MSPHAAGSLIADLVEMAKASETLPLIQADLDRANEAIEAYAKQVQRLELQAIDRKAEIDTLQSTIRTTEASRDDAEFRFLEIEDRLQSALAFVRTVFGNAGALIQALDPPKIEITPETFSVSTDSITPQPTGQSEPDPMTIDVPADATSTIASPTDSVAFTAAEPTIPLGPYFGLRYHDHPAYVTIHDWLAGGGTEEDYYDRHRTASY